VLAAILEVAEEEIVEASGLQLVDITLARVEQPGTDDELVLGLRLIGTSAFSRDLELPELLIQSR
jgi:hypothetical protein